VFNHRQPIDDGLVYPIAQQKPTKYCAKLKISPNCYTDPNLSSPDSFILYCTIKSCFTRGVSAEQTWGPTLRILSLLFSPKFYISG